MERVVVGSGAAGFAAALSAAVAGAEVDLIEATDVVGGTTALSGASRGCRATTSWRATAPTTWWPPGATSSRCGSATSAMPWWRGSSMPGP